MPHIPLLRYLAEPRFRIGRGPKLPERNRPAHGRLLEQQLRNLLDTVGDRRAARPRELPPPPEEVQLLLESSAARGKPILTEASLPKGWKLDVVEERPDGLLTAISRDPNLEKLHRSVSTFRRNERTETGRPPVSAT